MISIGGYYHISHRMRSGKFINIYGGNDIKKLCEKEGKSVLKMELAKGLAQVAYIYEPNTKRAG